MQIAHKKERTRVYPCAWTRFIVEQYFRYYLTIPQSIPQYSKIFHIFLPYYLIMLIFFPLSLHSPLGSSFWGLLRCQGRFLNFFFFIKNHSLPSRTSPSCEKGQSSSIKLNLKLNLKLILKLNLNPNLQAPQPSSNGGTNFFPSGQRRD